MYIEYLPDDIYNILINYEINIDERQVKTPMKKLLPGVGLSIFDIKLEATTAGPSPDNNKRTEVFLLGCKKAHQGDPCPGCFNSITWDTSRVEFTRDPVELAAFLNEITPNKYITIGGG